MISPSQPLERTTKLILVSTIAHGQRRWCLAPAVKVSGKYRVSVQVLVELCDGGKPTIVRQSLHSIGRTSP